MLGEKIREVRKGKNIKLREIAEKTKLSSSYLSQIERSLIEPSLSSLRKIAIALEVPIYEFLKDDERKGIVIKKDKRIKLELPDSHIIYEFLTPTKIDNNVIPNLEIIYMKLEPFSWSSEEPSYHAADECIFVIKGEIEVYLGQAKYPLCQGDSLYIQENTPHKIYNTSDVTAEAIFCISPPIY